jgi:pyruvate,orthophosphate dikinase
MDDNELLVLLDGEHRHNRSLIGGKAFSIASMAAMGLRVPAAFVLTTNACKKYLRDGRRLGPDLHEAIATGLLHLEKKLGRRFGAGPSPLLVSVRSGAPVSMPGMMDTVLDLGINDEVEVALGTEFRDRSFARETRCRFLECYGRIVLKSLIEKGEESDPTKLAETIYKDVGKKVPEDPWEQLYSAVSAVFDSWESSRAKSYRKHWNIEDDLGTAVTVQAMVYGNRDECSGTGVLFSRNPIDGSQVPFGEYIVKGQGEDVVSGERTPQRIEVLRDQMPEVYDELLEAAKMLEDKERDIQDIEFTIESGKLYFLQSRAAKRSPKAALSFVLDMYNSGVLSAAEVLSRISIEQARKLLEPGLNDEDIAVANLLANGEPACPGVAQGYGVSDCDEAVALSTKGVNVILLSHSTSPQDVQGMIASVAIATEVGGATSHAAVVSRQLGRPCVVGCGSGSLSGLAGRFITVDGTRGKVYADLGPLKQVAENDDPLIRELLDIARSCTTIEVAAPQEQTGEYVDLDTLGVSDLEDLAKYLTPGGSYKSVLFESMEGAELALQMRDITVITQSPLLVLLVASKVQQTSAKAWRNQDSTRSP